MNVFVRSAYWSKPPLLTWTVRRLCTAHRPRYSNALHSYHPPSRAAPKQVFLAYNLRSYQSFSPQSPRATEKSAVKPPLKPPADLGGDAVHVTVSEQRKKDWSIVKRLLKNIWPENDWSTRGRVILGFGLLISAKVRYARSLCQFQPYVTRPGPQCPSPAYIQKYHRCP